MMRVMASVGDAQAAVGEDGEGRGQLERGDLAAAEGERQAVIVAGERGDAQPPGERTSPPPGACRGRRRCPRNRAS